MWTEILAGYGLFILELLTLFGVIFAIVAAVIAVKQNKEKHQGELQIIDLSKKVEENNKKLRDFHLTEDELKQAEKAQKKAEKAQAKADKLAIKNGEKSIKDNKPILYVIDFKGDVEALETESLREEINAIINVANPERDEVLLRLESPGGVVYGYGLAASQLARLKQKGIKLTIAVDKVAASGGYMMACVADKIMAAPFAIIGSVGVVAQIPNIHRLLKKHNIDVDVMTAGEYKRTMTILGENTEKGKQKFQQELEQTHELFKQFVAKNRPQLDILQIATGEHWFGQQALQLNLVDEIMTSDDAILQAITDKSVLNVKFKQKKSLLDKIFGQVETRATNLLSDLFRRHNRYF